MKKSEKISFPAVTVITTKLEMSNNPIVVRLFSSRFLATVLTETIKSSQLKYLAQLLLVVPSL